MDQLDLIDSYRAFHPKTMDFSSILNRCLGAFHSTLGSARDGTTGPLPLMKSHSVMLTTPLQSPFPFDPPSPVWAGYWPPLWALAFSQTSHAHGGIFFSLLCVLDATESFPRRLRRGTPSEAVLFSLSCSFYPGYNPRQE